ncbi:MAG: hypothetical protein KDB06_04340, partial [Ilumatobacter sp.]|nr:hypothetical protein [Ilumatobacter sp.]
MAPQQPFRILADKATAERLVGALSRRQVFAAVGGSAALAAFLAACGDDNESSGTTSGGGSDTSTASTSGGGDSSANSFKLFTWAEYDDPDLMSKFGNIEITIFNSNEEAIQKLVSAGGNNGFDMICP